MTPLLTPENFKPVYFFLGGTLTAIAAHWKARRIVEADATATPLSPDLMAFWLCAGAGWLAFSRLGLAGCLVSVFFMPAIDWLARKAWCFRRLTPLLARTAFQHEDGTYAMVSASGFVTGAILTNLMVHIYGPLGLLTGVLAGFGLLDATFGMLDGAYTLLALITAGAIAAYRRMC